MKHTIIREEQAPPPITSIHLDVSPGELLGLYRAVARIPFEEYKRVSPTEVPAAAEAVNLFGLFKNVHAVAIEAGIMR